MTEHLQAFDGVFTKGQIKDIKNIIAHSKALGVDAAALLNDNPPAPKSMIRDLTDKITDRIKIRCPECGRPLNVSRIAERSDKYKEGYRTYLLCGASCCSNKGCGHEEFLKSIIDNGGKR